MAIRCCICGKPVEIPKRDPRLRANLLDVADERFYFHRDRPDCRAAVRRMQKMLFRKHLERETSEKTTSSASSLRSFAGEKGIG